MEQVKPRSGMAQCSSGKRSNGSGLGGKYVR